VCPCIEVHMILRLTALPPQKLHLNDKIRRANDFNSRIVTISWNETDTGQQTMYNVTVEPAVQGCNSSCVTEHPYMELKLTLGTAYNVTITTLVCNGSLQSNENNPFPILLQGMFESQ